MYKNVLVLLSVFWNVKSIAQERIFRSERDEITEGWREFYNEELHQTL